MSRKIELDKIVDVIIEQLENDGYFTFSPTGNSMEPFISSQDSVTLCKADNLKKYDIVLCKNDNNKYILHRIIKINKQNDFYIRGDIQLLIEHITSNNLIIGKISSYAHKNKTITKFDTFNVRLWNLFTFLRKANLKQDY